MMKPAIQSAVNTSSDKNIHDVTRKHGDVSQENVVQREINPLWHNMATHTAQSAVNANPQSGNSVHNFSSSLIQCMGKENEDDQQARQVSKDLQTKLTVGTPNDPYEKEADEVADKIQRMPDDPGSSSGQVQPSPYSVSKVQRMYSPHNLSVGSAGGHLQKRENSTTAQKPNLASVKSVIAVPGSGAALATNLRHRIEPVVGADLSNVKVHSDQRAQTAATDIQAKAFTHKNNIYLGAGQSSNDAGLMAHEATHTVQQGASSRLSRMPEVMRFPAVTPTAAETTHSPATIKALTLSSFNSLTTRQLDWATSAALQADAASLSQFRTIRSFAAGPGILTACSDFKVGDIIRKGVPAVFTPLRTYTKGVTTNTTAWLRNTNNVNDAENWGTELGKLEAAWNPANLSLIMKAPSPRANKSPFEKLVDPAGPEMPNFIAYLSACSPVLSAENGREVDSFMSLRAEGGMPHSYLGKVNYAETYHHFTKATLDGLVANEAWPQWKQSHWWFSKPFTAVLYPTVDHNGAFHRNLGLQNLVTRSDILTVVIEGHTTVSDYQTQLSPVATRYGMNGEIQQAMIGGHGNTNILVLAGSAAGASVTKDSLGTTGASGANTTALMTELTRVMSADPTKRRIILDACLTDSNHVATALRASPADAAADVQSAIAANPTLRDEVARMAGAGSTVLGANASFAPASTSFTTPGSTDITLQVPDDPDLVASKLQYVEFGTEPTGCLRAVLESWATDQIAGTSVCRDAMRRRIAAGQSTHVASVNTWREGIIQPLYDLIANTYWSNGNAIRMFEHLADKLFLLYWKNHTTAAQLSAALNVISGNVGQANKVFGTVSGDSRYSSVPRVAIIIEQAWMQVNAARRANFMSAFTRYANAKDASDHIDMPLVMPHVTHMLILPPASPPAVDQLRLALLATQNQPLTPPAPAILPKHIDFMQQVLGAGPTFPSAVNINTALGGLTDESTILTNIGRPLAGPPIVVGGGAIPPPRANIDLDRDATMLNDFNVTPLSMTGTVTTSGSNLMVRSRPTTSTVSNIFARLPNGTTVRIIGEYRNWYAIEQPGHTGFVYKRYII